MLRKVFSTAISALVLSAALLLAGPTAALAQRGGGGSRGGSGHSFSGRSFSGAGGRSYSGPSYSSRGYSGGGGRSFAAPSGRGYYGGGGSFYGGRGYSAGRFYAGRGYITADASGLVLIMATVSAFPSVGAIIRTLAAVTTMATAIGSPRPAIRLITTAIDRIATQRLLNEADGCECWPVNA